MSAPGSVFVDTDAAVAYFRGDRALRPLFAEATPLMLPWIVLGELNYGANRVPVTYTIV